MSFAASVSMAFIEVVLHRSLSRFGKVSGLLKGFGSIRLS